VTRFGTLVSKVDVRLPGAALPLLSVSQTRGVLRQSELSDRPPRAESLDNYKVCRKGDVVFNKMSIRAGAMGVAQEDGLVTYHYEVMRPKSGVDPRFVVYLMKSSGFTAELIKRERGIGAGSDASGVRTTEVPFSVLRTIDLDLPAVDSQRRTAEFLDRETAQIDALIAKQQQLISTLAERRRVLVWRLVTKGLATDNAFKPSGAAWIGEVPQRWATPRLGHLLQIRNGADYKEVQDDDGQYPVYGSGGEFARAKNYMHDGDALLLGRKGTIDRPLLVTGRFWTVDTMFYGVPIAAVDLRYLHFAALSFPYGELSTSTALPSMTASGLKAIRVPRPTLSEQRKIADALTLATREIDDLSGKASEAIQLLKERRQALISAAVTGNIDVGSRS
jgi:type I restriction enzyme S subunit